MSARHPIFLLSFLLCTACGCTRIQRAGECSRVAELVNRTVSEVAAEHKRGGERSKTYLAIASRYEQLHKDLARETPKNEALARTLDEYRNLLKQYSAALRRAAPSIDAKPAGSTRDQLALEALVRQEKSLTGRIDATCRAL